MITSTTFGILPAGGDARATSERLPAPAQQHVIVVTGSATSAHEFLGRQDAIRTRQYVVLPSPRHPRLLLPWEDRRRASSGLKLYMPFSRSGRILKWLANLAAQLRVAPRPIRIYLSSVDLLPLERMVADITGVPAPCFAAYAGVGPARRVVLQAMNSEGEILGYLKIPLESESEKKIRHEAWMLEHLSDVPAVAEHLPRVLFSGDVEGSYVLFQSALPGTPTESEFSEVQDHLLRDLHTAERSYINSAALVERSAAKWDDVAGILGADAMQVRSQAARLALRTLQATEIECGLAHGDFAPWNMRISGDRIALFDWESATLDSPLCWDRFHFHTQVKICLDKKVKPLRLSNPHEAALFIVYLLDSIPALLDANSRVDLDHRKRQMKNVNFRLRLLKHMVETGTNISQIEL